jgi:LysR family transcriptional regulator of gallate degradation
MDLAPLLRKLRAVQAVAAAGSTVDAAQALHVSQSSVVRAVKDAEAAFGFALFERSSRGMVPTACGRLVAYRVGRALELIAQADAHTARPPRSPVPGVAWQRSRLASGLGHRHVRTFLALVDGGSESRAAQALGVSQSAVHQTLAQAEHLAGEPLFYRARAGLRLNDAGEALLKALKLMLAEFGHAAADVAAVQGTMRGRVVIGTLPFSTGLFVPRALDRVLASHPALEVTVVDGTYATLLHQLRYAEIDVIVGALRDPPPADDVRQETLFDDRLAVVARRGHPLAGRPALRLRDLAHGPWVLPMPGTPAQAAFDQAFAAEGLAAPQERLRVNSTMMMQALLYDGDRLALMSPRHLEREIAAGLLTVLPVAVRHGPRVIGMTTRADYMPPPGVRVLLDSLRAAAREVATPGEPARAHQAP